MIIGAELAIADNGSLDGYFQGSQQQLSTNTTQATMFFSDGTLWETIAEAQGVGGDQWGVMNELWNFPGQVWLWLYSGMYQIPALNPSNNANLDLDVGLLMILFGFLLPMFAPWIPIINRIPRWIPLYKIIYRQYYASTAGGPPPAEVTSEPAPPPPAPDEIASVSVPELPEFDDAAVVTGSTGIAQNHYVRQNFHRCLDLFSVMWHHHTEFLMLGYGAYVVFFQFCKQAFPEISDQTVARMVAGIDVIMYRPDDELRNLARVAVEAGVDDLFTEGCSPSQVLAALADRGEGGKTWLAALEQAREPWFNVSTGDGFYHHHRSWSDDLTVPFAALPRYVAQVRDGLLADRPTEALRAERERIAAEYRDLLGTEEEQAAFDQMLGLCRVVFPYVEDHKFYCEHWFTTLFFGKIREFGALLARFGVLAEAEDVFQLHHTEVDQALSDVMLAWAAGSPPLGAAHFQPIVAERKQMLEALRAWSPPPALGPVPEALNDPAVHMLWGVTQQTIEAWLRPGGEIRGCGASSGIVEGPARVLTDVNQIGEVREGEILVCPVTAPSWAPVFGKIKATVSDIGGSMSHAAIVAREYGMPAVVGTGDATKRISTGQRIRVDGDRGIVQVIG